MVNSTRILEIDAPALLRSNERDKLQGKGKEMAAIEYQRQPPSNMTSCTYSKEFWDAVLQESLDTVPCGRLVVLICLSFT